MKMKKLIAVLAAASMLASSAAALAAEPELTDSDAVIMTDAEASDEAAPEAVADEAVTEEEPVEETVYEEEVAELSEDSVTVTTNEGGDTYSLTFEGTTVNPVYKIGEGFYQDGEIYDNSINFYITNYDGFLYFRKLVNKEEDFADRYTQEFTNWNGTNLFQNNVFTGKTVHLLDDIDLDGKGWDKPIGYVVDGGPDKTHFFGRFNGHNHTISNLSLSADSTNKKAEYGLFGRLGAPSGSDKSVISNLTLNNVSIAGGTYVGGFAGNAQSNPLDFVNCNVTGTISLYGSFVGGIYGIGNCSVNDCSVIADENSVIKGISFAGGIIGAERCSASSNLTVSGNTVENVDISSIQYSGGIIGGMASGAAGNLTMTNNTVKNSAITGAAYTGTIIGGNYNSTTAKTITGNSADSDTVAVNNNVVVDKQLGWSIAAIGDTEYGTLNEAFTAAQAGDTVRLIEDVTLTEKVNISKSNVTFDGDGHTITVGENAAWGAVQKFGSDGNLITVSGDNVTVKNLNLVNNLYRGLSLLTTVGGSDAAYINNTYTGVSSGHYYGSPKGTVTFKDCKFDVNGYAMHASKDVSTFEAVIDNCDVKGWTSFGAATFVTVKNSKFDGSYDKFNGADMNGRLAKLRFYCNASVTNTTFTSKFFDATPAEGETVVNAGNIGLDASGEGSIVIAVNGCTAEGGDIADLINESTIDNPNAVIAIDGQTENGKYIDGLFYSKTKSKVKDAVADNKYVKAVDGMTDYYELEDNNTTVKDTASAMTTTVELNDLENTLDAKDPTYDPKTTAQYNVVMTDAPAADKAKVDEVLAASPVPQDTESEIYDISVFKTEAGNTEKVNMDNVEQKVTVTVGKKILANTTPRVLHIKADGTAEWLTARRAGDYTIEFITTSFSTFYIEYQSAPTDENEIAQKINVTFENEVINGSSAEYDLVISGADDKVINRFMSSKWLFHLTGPTVSYEITPVTNVNMLTNEEYTDYPYELNMSGTVYEDATGKKITLAKVKITGIGEYAFTVLNAEVHTSKIKDNIVVDFKTSDGVDGTLIRTGTGYDNGDDDQTQAKGELKTAKGKLTVNVVFPNEALNNDIAYQDMTMRITGGDLSSEKVIKLGSDWKDNTTGIDKAEDLTVTYTAKAADADAAYTVVLDKELSQNVAYTVSVEGAGYRTARYTVNMGTTDKELTFWNNVMDNAKVIETGSTKTGVVKNFLAGDIVKDNIINLYDLSAVVSYFGTTGLTAASHPEYAKYDLNRDGMIDSKDIAYVLVSWDN